MRTGEPIVAEEREVWLTPRLMGLDHQGPLHGDKGRWSACLACHATNGPQACEEREREQADRWRRSPASSRG